jgi:hypothetical protein
MKEQLSGVLLEVLEKMCEFANVDFASIDFMDEKEPYYSKYAWTKQQESDFTDWFYDYLYHNADARKQLMAFPSKTKRSLDRFIPHFLLSYGFRTVNQTTT